MCLSSGRGHRQTSCTTAHLSFQERLFTPSARSFSPSRFHSVFYCLFFPFPHLSISHSVSTMVGDEETGLSSHCSLRFFFFFFEIWISSTASRGEKKESFQKKKTTTISSFLPSFSGTHPCFHLQQRAESRSWPDSRGGFHVTETGAKGSESYSLHFLLIAHCSSVIRFPDCR